MHIPFRLKATMWLALFVGGAAIWLGVNLIAGMIPRPILGMAGAALIGGFVGYAIRVCQEPDLPRDSPPAGAGDERGPEVKKPRTRLLR